MKRRSVSAVFVLLFVIAGLAIMGILPEWTAQYAPLVMVPLLAGEAGRSLCCTLGAVRAA